MLRTDLPDHRRSSEVELLDALRAQDPLALAEAYHRTVPAAHAVARRIFSSSSDVEALLRALYSELWTAPPDTPLERWTRQRTFRLGTDELAERGAAPASPSLAALLPELPAPEVRFLDAAERALAELDDRDRLVLLTAHDRGVPTWEQDGEDAAAGLHRALLSLAGPEATTDPEAQADACTDVERLGDWVLGLVDADLAETLTEVTGQRPGCAAVTRALRRGRRRLEGLPATPDMGQRVLVTVLAAAGGPLRIRAAGTLGSALDTAATDTETTGELEPVATERAVWGPEIDEPADSTPAPGDLRLADILADERSASLSDATKDDADQQLAEVEVTDEATADDEPVVWDYDELGDPDARPSAGRRALRAVGWLLLIAAGSVVGLYLGTLLVS